MLLSLRAPMQSGRDNPASIRYSVVPPFRVVQHEAEASHHALCHCEALLPDEQRVWGEAPNALVVASPDSSGRDSLPPFHGIASADFPNLAVAGRSKELS